MCFRSDEARRKEFFCHVDDASAQHSRRGVLTSDGEYETVPSVIHSCHEHLPDCQATEDTIAYCDSTAE